MLKRICASIAIAALVVAQTPIRNPVVSGSLASSTGPMKVTNGALSVGAINLSGAEATGTIAAGRMPALTGDVTTAAGAVATTLATVNVAPGSCGDTTHVCVVVTNGKGLVTSQSTALVSGGGGGGGASIQTDLTDIKATTNGATTITVPAGAMPRFGQTVCANYGGGNVVMTSGTAVVYVSVGNDCAVYATSTAVFGTATSMTTASGIDYPVNHFPLARCTYTGTVPSITCVDDRRAFSTMALIAGTGTSITRSASGYTIASSGGGGGGSTTTGGSMDFPMGGCTNTGAAVISWGISNAGDGGLTADCGGESTTLPRYAYSNTTTDYMAQYRHWPSNYPGATATVNGLITVTQQDDATTTHVAKVLIYLGCSTPGTTNLTAFFASTNTLEFTIPPINATKEVSIPAMTVPATCTANSFMGVALRRDNATAGTNMAFPLRIIAVQLQY